MTGMELSKSYWEEIGKPVFVSEIPDIMDFAAVGLVGEGSDCFCLDDATSVDHDWGTGFCMWLSGDTWGKYHEHAEKVYSGLPENYKGFKKKTVSSEALPRIGILNTEKFYYSFLGIKATDISVGQWWNMPETGLAVATNGELFLENDNLFCDIRAKLKDYYPKDIYLKKLSARCALAAQSGQYNYYRCVKRGDSVAAFRALAEFVDHTQEIIFLLNRKYRPYYKLAHRSLASLPVLGSFLAPLFESLVNNNTYSTPEIIENICCYIREELNNQMLTEGASDYLLDQANELHSKIEIPALKNLPVMAYKNN